MQLIIFFFSVTQEGSLEHLLSLLWDKEYTLTYKEKVRYASMTGAENMVEAVRILSLIEQEHIKGTIGKQLAEDHLANIDSMPCKAGAAIKIGMERAGYEMPEVLKKIVEGRLPNNCATVRAVLIPLRYHKNQDQKSRQ